MFLVFLTSCAESIEFHRGAFPLSSDADGLSEGLVYVHIYIQSTPDMGELLGTDYERVLAMLVGTPEVPGTAEGIWTSHGISQHLYRFDVLWLEPEREFEAHGSGRAFAYPLDPIWWTTEGVYPQIPQIFETGFYSLEWYMAQDGRAPGVYRNRIYGPGWNSEEQRYLSRTIDEIATLRNGDREISIIATNFIGRPSEDAVIRSAILNFLWGNDQQAISTFVFENEGSEFYFLIFGSTREVSDFSNRLNERLLSEPELSTFEFNFYTTGSPVSHVIGNAGVSVENTFRGVRPVFESDLSPSEISLFNEYLGNHALIYNIWPRLIDNEYAPISLNVHLDIPQALRSRVVRNFVAIPSIFVVSEDEMVRTIPVGSTSVIVSSDTFLYDGYVNLLVNIDTSIFESRVQKVHLTVGLYTSIDIETGSTLSFGNALFRSTFGQLITNISREKEQRRLQGEPMRHLVAQSHIHLIYRR